MESLIYSIIGLLGLGAFIWAYYAGKSNGKKDTLLKVHETYDTQMEKAAGQINNIVDKFNAKRTKLRKARSSVQKLSKDSKT